MSKNNTTLNPVDEEMSELLTNSTMVMPDGEEATIAEAAADIAEAHKEVEQYKQGALTLTQVLDERIIEAEQADDDELVAALENLKHAAYGVYVRVNRGDDEVFGDRDGNYSGYFDEGNESE